MIKEVKPFLTLVTRPGAGFLLQGGCDLLTASRRYLTPPGTCRLSFCRCSLPMLQWSTTAATGCLGACPRPEWTISILGFSIVYESSMAAFSQTELPDNCWVEGLNCFLW